MIERFTFLIIWSLGFINGQQIPCDQRLFVNESSFVCVCNANGCDSFGQISFPNSGFYHHTVSSKDEFRFDQRISPIVNNGTSQAAVPTSLISINDTDLGQRMFGFGGAFTDSAGINIASLSRVMQDQLMRGYFSPDGLEYNIARIPIAGCDFSTRPYSYDDVEDDADLVFFNLTMEDYVYKIPYIKEAMELNSRNMLFFGSPWSPPSWMKTNGMFNGSGSLLPEYNQSWANYFIKFVDAYKMEGIDMWGLTSQNEPTVGLTDWDWNACGFTGEMQRDFIRDYLGPTLSAAGMRYLKLMTADDNREVFPHFPTQVLDDAEANAYVDGVAVHWYADNYTPVTVVTTVHNRFPDKFILYTEACTGYLGGEANEVRLGSWERGESYALDILENVNHWSSGWVDWNLALDMMGGPNWSENFVDSPIIINKDNDEFYRQPMYYVLGHFSKFISEGYFYIGTSVINGGKAEKIYAAAFTNPTQEYIVVVVTNTKETEEVVNISDVSGNQFDVSLPARSINTLVYGKNQ